MTHWRCLSQEMKSRKHFIVMFVCKKLKCSQQARTVFSDGQLAGLERRWHHHQTNNSNPNYKMINRLKPDWWGIHFAGFRPSVIFQLQSGSNLPEPWLWARLRSRLGSKTGESLNLMIFFLPSSFVWSIKLFQTLSPRRMKHKKYLRKQVEGEDGEARDSEEVIRFFLRNISIR